MLPAAVAVVAVAVDAFESFCVAGGGTTSAGSDGSAGYDKIYHTSHRPSRERKCARNYYK